MFSAILICALAFAESKSIAVQIALDRAGYSCNTIDGVWGRKSDRALAAYLASRGTNLTWCIPPELAYDRYFTRADNLFRIETVTAEDLKAVAPLPAEPAERAKLARMGYETIKEMFAERGHVSQRALERMNPGVDWEHVAVGTKLVIPNFTSISDDLKAHRPPADHVVVDMSNFEVRVYGKDGRIKALLPCSIARSKSKLPPAGELKIVSAIARPNYTYTPDFTPAGKKPKRYVWPEGENCPIGVAWLGLNLPTYGLHGTPRPESIGNAESHGCFRLANWNAARLFSLCPPGTRVVVKP